MKEEEGGGEEGRGGQEERGRKGLRQAGEEQSETEEKLTTATIGSLQRRR